PGPRVPANFRADPLATARALVEVLFGFFDGDGEGVVVRFAANSTLDVISTVARAGQNSAKNVAGGAQQVACHARHRSLEARHISGAALVAVKPELIATVSGKVVKISSESNECHGGLLLFKVGRGTDELRGHHTGRSEARQGFFP